MGIEMEAFDFIESLIEDMIKVYKKDKADCEMLHESTERIEGKIEALEELLYQLNK